MANEISYQFQVRLANGSLSDQYSSPSQRTDQTNARLIRNVQEIGTTEESLETGDLATPGWSVWVNLEDIDVNPTYYVEVGSYVSGTFYPFLKVEPGDQMVCKLGISTAQLYAKAYNGTVSLFYIIYDD